jgi:Transglycosylase SLT domain
MRAWLKRALERATSALGQAISRWPKSLFIGFAAITAGLAMVFVLAAGGVTARSSMVGRALRLSPGRAGPAPRPAGPGGPGQAGGSPTATGLASAYSGIVLPDLLIVLPTGLTAGDVSGLRRVGGVRKMITFDGAQITVAGKPASVIGVNPRQFRSWVPLRAASSQALWTTLSSGGMIASDPAGRLLGLSRGASYQLSAGTAARVRYGGSARLNITGVDLLVSQHVSRQLGLVHRVAALISAPGPAIATLTAAVRRVLGPTAKVVVLRRSRLPVTTVQPGQITSYLQLFQASAAKYCPAMSWTVLAAIGQIESADGTNMGPSSAGALGPMQFMPSTWAAWGIDGFGRSGPPDIMNPLDAVPSAARMLCADGAASGTQAGLRQAIFAYNHATWYVNEVLALAGQYAADYR